MTSLQTVWSLCTVPRLPLEPALSLILPVCSIFPFTPPCLRTRVWSSGCCYSSIEAVLLLYLRWAIDRSVPVARSIWIIRRKSSKFKELSIDTSTADFPDWNTSLREAVIFSEKSFHSPLRNYITRDGNALLILLYWTVSTLNPIVGTVETTSPICSHRESWFSRHCRGWGRECWSLRWSVDRLRGAQCNVYC